MSMELLNTLERINEGTEAARLRADGVRTAFDSNVEPENGVFGAVEAFAGEQTEVGAGDWQGFAEKMAYDEGVKAEVRNAVKEIATPDEKILPTKIKCLNEALEGKRHPETGVLFERRTVNEGTKWACEGVFPRFDAVCSVKIPTELYPLSHKVQFKEANRQLWELVSRDDSLRAKFTAEQLEDIEDGMKTGAAPEGYVWHHNEEAGILQLVDARTHLMTNHTGGNKIWGNNT